MKIQCEPNEEKCALTTGNPRRYQRVAIGFEGDCFIEAIVRETFIEFVKLKIFGIT